MDGDCGHDICGVELSVAGGTAEVNDWYNSQEACESELLVTLEAVKDYVPYKVEKNKRNQQSLILRWSSGLPKAKKSCIAVMFPD